MTAPPFSLYVHIPYCHSKCPYCDFNSHAATRWPEGEYVKALIAELELYATHPEWHGPIQTIFFGGGTPSLFAPESIASVLESANRLWPTRSTDPPEITLEANPGTVTLDKLTGFRHAGINRISFGVQSFHAQHLATLGRMHSSAEAIAAIEGARTAGFDDLNFDLIFAVPGQTLIEWETDVRTAVALAPDHLSAYNLTFEEGTAFHAMRAKGQLLQAPEEIEVAMFTHTHELLGAAGYRAYEISNYAQPGRECRHNLNYWRGGAYLGIGAGAHSFSRSPAPGRRWSNEKGPAAYISAIQHNRHARVWSEQLAEVQARGEFVFLNLRLRDGFDQRDFCGRFGVDFLTAFPHAATLQHDGLLTATDDRWHLSPRGLLLADSVFATFL